MTREEKIAYLMDEYIMSRAEAEANLADPAGFFGEVTCVAPELHDRTPAPVPADAPLRMARIAAMHRAGVVHTSSSD